MLTDMLTKLKKTSCAECKRTYKFRFNKIISEIENPLFDHCFWLQSPSGYIFSTSGTLWGVDLQLKTIPGADEIYEQSAEGLKGLQYVFLTHEHNDHLDCKLMTKLANTNITWLIPTFFQKERIYSTGVSKDRIIWVEDGKQYNCDSLTVDVFKSQHFRPDGAGTHEFGYFIDTGKVKLLFPGDVRRYSADLFPRFNCDCIFSHVWFGGESACNSPFEPFLSDFCRFTASFNPKNIFLTHLFVMDRSVNETWTHIHAELAKSKILLLNPHCNVTIPELGERCSLL